MIGEKTEIDIAAPLRSYGRRKAKPLSARKERLIGELLPRLRLDLTKAPPRSLAALFAKPTKATWLEIGFGSGEHLLWQAERHEDVGFIGCEPFINGMASLLGAVETSGIATIRLHNGDARDVLAWLPDGSIGPIPGPSAASKSGGSSRATPSANSPACSCRAASSGLPPIAATMRPWRSSSPARAAPSSGMRKGRPIGGRAGPTGPKPAMSAKP
jgi:hypothetical protein